MSHTEPYIHELYRVFSIYPRRDHIDGCPCCVSNDDKEMIHSKPLKELNEDDLSRYVFKSMTTWGSVEDFKYFLPRIMELFSQGAFNIYHTILFDKLWYGKWNTWPEAEQQALKDFLLEWWAHYIHYTNNFDLDVLTGIDLIINNTEKLLERWKINFNDQSFSNFVQLVHDHFNRISQKGRSGTNIFIPGSYVLEEWINSQVKYLEQGFFHYENTDPPFAQKISDTIYIYEVLKSPF